MRFIYGCPQNDASPRMHSKTSYCVRTRAKQMLTFLTRDLNQHLSSSTRQRRLEFPFITRPIKDVDGTSGFISRLVVGGEGRKPFGPCAIDHELRNRG